VDTRILSGGLLVCLSVTLGCYGLAKLIAAYREGDFVAWSRLAILGVIGVLSGAVLVDVAWADLALYVVR
jgi:hypothetical protein